ncbi:hypothetical protein AAFC00_005734 [Neodothiora populina]|uniref:SCA7 domain-containing protein n=1 Tax=Neodothiora populina TaxID=2781224 RepID=A0ABR3P5N0_9PEZI
MAPNGSSRKTPTNTPNGKTKSINFFKSSSSPSGKTGSRSVKVKDEWKKKLPKAAKPGTWDTEVVGGEVTSPAVSINRIPHALASSFSTGKPLQDVPDIVKCNHCKRPILRHKAKTHIEDCLLKKQEKQRRKKEAKDARDAAARADRARDNSETPEAEDSILGGDGGRKTTAGKTEAGGKKRKAEDEGLGGKHKKKKKDDLATGAGKAKLPRPKAPVDVEKQCGVELPNGGQCARSLTCKSHSMGAKRAVPGRSAPYDKLLADYQRKNQAKLQKAALDAMEPNQDDEMAQNGPIDSDEEKDLVMAALARSRPQPLYELYRVPLKQKYQMVRMKEMLGSALGGRSGGGLFRTTPREEQSNGTAAVNGLANGMTNGITNTGGEGPDRRMSGINGRIPSVSGASRKASVA